MQRYLENIDAIKEIQFGVNSEFQYFEPLFYQQTDPTWMKLWNNLQQYLLTRIQRPKQNTWNTLLPFIDKNPGINNKIDCSLPREN